MGIRFTHSPCGGGNNTGIQTTNPAWDIQYLAAQPGVMNEYSFKMRTILRPRCSGAAVLEEFRKWKQG